MNTDGLSYLSTKDYFRDYNDENLSSVLEAIVGKYGKKILLEEDLLKQELNGYIQVASYKQMPRF